MWAMLLPKEYFVASNNIIIISFENPSMISNNHY